MTMQSNYIRQLEGLGFYAKGHPVDGMLRGDVLRDARKHGADAEHMKFRKAGVNHAEHQQPQQINSP